MKYTKNKACKFPPDLQALFYADLIDLFTASSNGYKRQNFILYFVEKPRRC